MTNNKNELLTINLQAFAEDAAPAADAGSSQAVSGFAAADGSIQGVAAPQEGGQAVSAQQPVDRNAEFEKLIKGEYKDLYDKRVKQTVEKRMKGHKETAERYNKLIPIVSTLASKYGIDAEDIDGLSRAIDNDNSYWDAIAMEKGISVEEAKRFAKLEGENATLRQWKRDNEALMAEESTHRIMQDWQKQEEELKQIVPNFSLDEALQDPEFFAIVKTGLSLESAYFALHHREHFSDIAQTTAKQVESKLANKIAAGAGRPVEGALGNQAASSAKVDISTMSKADLEKLFNRALGGEKIRFD